MSSSGPAVRGDEPVDLIFGHTSSLRFDLPRRETAHSTGKSEARSSSCVRGIEAASRPRGHNGKRAPILRTGQSHSFSPRPTCSTASRIHNRHANESRFRVSGFEFSGNRSTARSPSARPVRLGM
jgi:hypothetical protein